MNYTHSLCKFPGHRLKPSCNGNLSCSCVNAESFNPLSWARDRTRSFAAIQAIAIGFLIHSATARAPEIFFFFKSSPTYPNLLSFYGRHDLSWFITFALTFFFFPLCPPWLAPLSSISLWFQKTLFWSFGITLLILYSCSQEFMDYFHFK